MSVCKETIDAAAPNDMAWKSDAVSLPRIFAQYRWRLLGTWSLVVIESGLMLLFPLLMGMAIDGLLQQSYFGLYLLAATGIFTLLAGAARRFYDTRLYARIYTAAAQKIVEQERERDTEVSVISARTSMATELVEFLENSFPQIVESVIGLGGTLLMIWLLQGKVFAGCLAAAGIIFGIYAVTSRKTYVLNRGYNDQSEKSVDVLSGGTIQEVSSHFRGMMRWNIRLSDLETVNFSLSWLVMIGVLVFSVVATIQSGITAHGRILSILMYVFGYIESAVAIPLFYQQFVRLQEISGRLTGTTST